MTKKVRFIDALTSLSTAEKEKTAAFFTKYPLLESCIDWNDKSLTFADIKKVFCLPGFSRGAAKQKAKKDPALLFEKYNCQIIGRTEDFLIIIPRDWKCAVFLNSFNCGGSGAKWCVGSKSSPRIWNDYLKEGTMFYFVYFLRTNPFLGKKILLEFSGRTGKINLWLQNDRLAAFGIFGALLREHYQICAEDPNDRQGFFDFDNILIDNKKVTDNYFLLQLVKKAYETEYLYFKCIMRNRVVREP